jgi:hypothetical protein
MIETKTENAFQLGNWLGRKQAFAALAGRWRGDRCRMPAPGPATLAIPRGRWFRATPCFVHYLRGSAHAYWKNGGTTSAQASSAANAGQACKGEP